jgi:hypothetical protein
LLSAVNLAVTKQLIRQATRKKGIDGDAWGKVRSKFV